MRGYQKEGVVDAIRKAGGEIYGITSEPQTLASEAAESWEVGFPLVGDPHHEIADDCRGRGWLDLFVNRYVDPTGMISRGHDAPVHPKGYFQPGVIALSSDERILYRWRGVPTRENNGGATERPTASHVWQSVEKALAESNAPDAELDTPPAVDMKGIPWPFFVLLLLANGNFWRPRGFGLRRRGPDDIGLRAKWAMLKLALFVAGWIAAFVFLPFEWVAISLLAWAAVMTPGIAEMHRTFQNAQDSRSRPLTHNVEH